MTGYAFSPVQTEIIEDYRKVAKHYQYLTSARKCLMMSTPGILIGTPADVIYEMMLELQLVRPGVRVSASRNSLVYCIRQFIAYLRDVQASGKHPEWFKGDIE